MSFNPGVSGISGATDVALSAKQNNQVLTYDSSVDKWRNDAVSQSSVTGLTTALDARALKASSVGVAQHGTNASMNRPSGWASVMWIGSVAPLNAQNNTDTWLDTSA